MNDETVTYIVKSPLKHNINPDKKPGEVDKVYVLGDSIELTRKEADPLIKAGVVMSPDQYNRMIEQDKNAKIASQASQAQLQEKDAEIERLRAELEASKKQAPPK